jgi:hypothetical protein
MSPTVIYMSFSADQLSLLGLEWGTCMRKLKVNLLEMSQYYNINKDVLSTSQPFGD